MLKVAAFSVALHGHCDIGWVVCSRLKVKIKCKQETDNRWDSWTSLLSEDRRESSLNTNYVWFYKINNWRSEVAQCKLLKLFMSTDGYITLRVI